MLPSHSPEFQFQRKSPKSPNFNLNSLKYQIYSNPKLWGFSIFLFIQLLIVYITRNSPPCFAVRTPSPAADSARVSAAVPNATRVNASSVSAAENECLAGRVYVYDLPSKFNRDLLLDNCSDLNPWNWQCGIATNHGFGGPAAELRRVLPRSLANSWYRTNQFSLELIFHHRITNHKCRTMDPDSAAAYYIPFYAGLAVGKYLWTNDTSLRDRHCRELLQWVTKQKPWRKSNGSDHFTSIGRITWDFRRLTDPGQVWGSTYLNMPEMLKVTRFIIEKAPGDTREYGVPYPTGFHPKDRKTLVQWQNYVRDTNRSSLFTFIGATRGWVSNDFRGLLLNQCYKESGSCRVVDCSQEQCSTDSSVVMEALLGSDFCLQPRGDSFTRRSVFDCMLAGSVPVFFWKRTAYDQYEGFLPGDPESYSVYIDHEEVRAGKCTVKEVLKRYSREDIRKKREKIIETIIPRIIYGLPSGGFGDFKDALEIAVEGVLERIKEEKEWTDFL